MLLWKLILKSQRTEFIHTLGLFQVVSFVILVIWQTAFYVARSNLQWQTCPHFQQIQASEHSTIVIRVVPNFQCCAALREIKLLRACLCCLVWNVWVFLDHYSVLLYPHCWHFVKNFLSVQISRGMAVLRDVCPCFICFGVHEDVHKVMLRCRNVHEAHARFPVHLFRQWLVRRS